MVKQNLTRFFLVALASSGLLLTPTVASAGGSADARAKAERHFETGKALYAAENYEGAATEFEASVAAYPTKSGYFNLANCYKALHRYAEALDAIDQMRTRLAAEMRSDPALTARIDEIERSIRGLVGTLIVTSTPPGAAISVDREPVGTTPLSRALLLGPGEHIVTAERSGFVAAEQRVTVLSRGESRLAFELKKEQARLNVRVSASQAEVRLDGRLVGLSPLQEALLLEPGRYAVDVTLAGYLPNHREFVLAAGDDVVLDISLVPESVAQGAVPAVSTRTLRTLAWAALGSAIALGGTSLVLVSFREQAIDEFNKEDQLYFDASAKDASKHKALRDDAGSRAELLHGFAIGAAITAGVCATVALTTAVVAAMQGKKQRKSKAEIQAGLFAVEVRF